MVKLLSSPDNTNRGHFGEEGHSEHAYRAF